MDPMALILLNIGITLFLVLIFRRLDKQNQRLQKVKQYVERIINRLELYEKERVGKAAVQEAAITELINRAETLNKLLNARLDELASKEERIEKAGRAVDETDVHLTRLLSQTEKFNHDMERVHAESEKLKDIESDIRSLKKELTDFSGTFKEQEQKLFSELQEHHKEAGESLALRVETVNNQVLLTQKKLSEKLNTENTALMTIIKRIKDTFSFSEKNILEQIEKLRHQTGSITEEVVKSVQSREESLLRESLSRIQKLNDVVKSIEATHMNNKNMMVESFKDDLKGLEGMIAESKEKFNAGLQSLQKEAAGKVHSFQDTVDKMQESMRIENSASLEEVKKHLAETRSSISHAAKDFDRIRSETMDLFNTRLTETQKKTEEKEKALFRSVEERISTFTGKTNGLLAEYNESCKSLQKTISEKISELDRKTGETLRNINASEQSARSAVEALSGSFKGRLDQLEKDAISTAGVNTGQVYEKFSKEVDLKLEAVHSAFEKNIRILNETAHTVQSQLKTDQDKHLETLNKQVKKIQSDVNSVGTRFSGIEKTLLEDIRIKIENLNKDYTSRFSKLGLDYKVFEETLNKNINTGQVYEKFTKEVDFKLETINTAFEKNMRNLNETAHTIESQLKADQDKYIDTLNKQIKKIQSDVNSVGARFSGIEKSLLEDIQTKIDNLNKDYTSRLSKLGLDYKVFEDNLNKKISTGQVYEKFSVEVESKLESLNSDFEKNMRILNDTSHTIQSQLKTDQEKHIELLTTQIKKIQSDVNSVGARFSGIEKSLLEDIQSRIDNLNKDYALRLSKLDMDYKDFEDTLSKNINKEIADFNSRLNTVLDRYNKSEETLLKESKDKVAGRMKELEAQILEKEDGIIGKTRLEMEQIRADLQKLEDMAKSGENYTKQYSREIGGFEARFKDLEDTLLQNTRSRIENMDSLYTERLKDIEGRVEEQETGLIDRIKKDIEQFDGQMKLVMDRYKTTEQELLNETKIRVAGFENTLGEFEDKLKTLEKDHNDRIQQKIKGIDTVIDERLAGIEAKVIEKEKKILEHSREETAKISENIRKLEGVIRESENESRQSYKNMMKSFNDTLVKLREKAEKTTEEAAIAGGERLELFRRDIAEKVKYADQAMDRILADMQKKGQEKTAKISSEFQELKDGTKKEITAFMNDLQQRLEEMSTELSELTRKKEGMENSFTSAIKSQVEVVNNALTKKIQEFSFNLKNSEKESSTATKEFLEQLKKDYETSRAKIVAHSTELMSKEEKKILDLGGRVDQIGKQMEYFLKETKIFESADKFKAEMKENILKYEEDIKKLKAEKKYFSQYETKITALRKQGDIIQTVIDGILKERKEVEQFQATIAKITKDMNEMDARLEYFKKENEQISVLNEKFQGLDALTEKINANMAVISEKEMDLNRYGSIVDNIGSNYTKLEKTADSNSNKIGTMEERSSRLDRTLKDIENRTAKLGAEDKRLHSIIDQLGEIEGIVTYLDKARKDLANMKDWVIPQTEDLKKYMRESEQKKKDLDDILRQIKSILSRQNGLDSIFQEASDVKNPPSEESLEDIDPEKGRIIMRLYNNEKWSYEEIARNVKLSVDSVKKYIRRNL